MSVSADPGYNPHRTDELFTLTTDGFIIAHDIVCQYEYVDALRCPETGKRLKVIAQINRSFQGLNEVVAVSLGTGKQYNFIFDISNDVYQSWWAETMGDFYVRTFDGPGRKAASKHR
jgi:hypothetical protein